MTAELRCDRARRLVSDRVDGDLADREAAALAGHLGGCAACRGFATQLDELRRRLRVSSVDRPADLTGRVRAAVIARRRWHARTVPAQAAAAFVVAFAVAAAAVGLGGPPTARAGTIPELVLDGQTRVQRLAAAVTVSETGWHPAVPERRYRGTLAYAAPETFQLELEDRTRYPDASWRPNDVVFAIDRDTAWQQGLRGCPVSALPSCTPPQPRRSLATGREPFDATEPSPLDLVVPVASLSAGGTDRDLGTRSVAGRDAVGIAVPAAQISPMLDAITAAGNWRDLHPADRAELWLDRDTGVPLHVTIRAGDTLERSAWATARGYDDRPGTALLTWELTAVEINGEGPPDPDPPAGDGWDRTDRGFVARPATLTPGWLPEGMRPHRSGESDGVAIASWTDGRAWVVVRSTGDWRGARLFGTPTDIVERVPLGDGVAYASAGGRRLQLHATDRDVEVTGSVAPDDLERIAASLGVTGVRIPDAWMEGGATTLAAASAAMPGLLAPADLDGFRGPAVAVEDGTVALGYVGGGSRAFVLTRRPGDVLRPPVDDVVLGVEVRATAGRYTPARGELEWVEDGHAHVLRSATLSLNELLDVAAALRRARP